MGYGVGRYVRLSGFGVSECGVVGFLALLLGFKVLLGFRTAPLGGGLSLLNLKFKCRWLNSLSIQDSERWLGSMIHYKLPPA